MALSRLFMLTAYLTPTKIHEIMPLIGIISALSMFIGLSRSSELVVTRGAGRSALRAILPAAVVAFLIGVVSLLTLNPILSATGKRHDTELAAISNQTPQSFALGETGIWLRQGTRDTQTVIHALRGSVDGQNLFGVTVHVLDTEGRPLSRIRAEKATLGEGVWILSGAKQWQFQDTPNPEAAAQTAPRIELATDLTAQQIQDSFGVPSAIPIWDLPAFIRQLEPQAFRRAGI